VEDAIVIAFEHGPPGIGFFRPDTAHRIDGERRPGGEKLSFEFLLHPTGSEPELAHRQTTCSRRRELR
jgi:hypothetical protein